MTTKMSTMEILGSTSTPKALSTPMRREASTKASTITVVSMTVVRARRGTWSAPASPARNDPRMKTPVKSLD